jgi:hypothetical protein
MVLYTKTLRTLFTTGACHGFLIQYKKNPTPMDFPILFSWHPVSMPLLSVMLEAHITSLIEFMEQYCIRVFRKTNQ